MRSTIKFKCPSCGKQIESQVEINDFNEAVKLNPPCQCGFSQVVLSALSSGIDSMIPHDEKKK